MRDGAVQTPARRAGPGSGRAGAKAGTQSTQRTAEGRGVGAGRGAERGTEGLGRGDSSLCWRMARGLRCHPPPRGFRCHPPAGARFVPYRAVAQTRICLVARVGRCCPEPPQRTGALVDLVVGVILRLVSEEFRGAGNPQGPYFHRWLPDGKSDAISLPAVPGGACVHVWFERRARLEGDWLRFDWKGTGFSAELMERQTPLDAGFLCAETTVAGADPRAIGALDRHPDSFVPEDDPEAAAVLTLAKRIHKQLYAPTCAFVDRLRVQFGQYWLQRLESYDPRRCSLGQWFAAANAYWEKKGEHTRRRFLPQQPRISFAARIHRFEPPDCITRDDWEYLRGTSASSPAIPLGCEILVDAHRYLQSGDIARALVEGATAIELIIEHLLAQAYSDGTKANKKAKGFADSTKLGLPDKLVAVAASHPTVDKDLVSDALEAIKYRDEVVHEGSRFSKTSDAALSAKHLVELGRQLAGLVPFKLPAANFGGRLYPAEAGGAGVPS